VNDTQLLVFGNIKESNYQRLTKIHDRYIQKKILGMKFAPDKYEFIHFSRKRRRDTRIKQTYLIFPNILIIPNIEIKILNI
jgi:hypothetical protein